MKKSEALKAVRMMKEGKQYRKGHYSCGYENLYWDDQKGLFIQKSESMGLDYFNPDISINELSENEMLDLLVGGFTFADFRDGAA